MYIVINYGAGIYIYNIIRNVFTCAGGRARAFQNAHYILYQIACQNKEINRGEAPAADVPATHPASRERTPQLCRGPSSPNCSF